MSKNRDPVPKFNIKWSDGSDGIVDLPYLKRFHSDLL